LKDATPLLIWSRALSLSQPVAASTQRMVPATAATLNDFMIIFAPSAGICLPTQPHTISHTTHVQTAWSDESCTGKHAGTQAMLSVASYQWR
jgi:hypothetical protein